MAYDRYDRERRWREGRPRILRRPRPARLGPRRRPRPRLSRSEKTAASSSAPATKSRSWFGDEDAERRPRIRSGPRRRTGKARRQRSRFDEPGRSQDPGRDDERSNRAVRRRTPSRLSAARRRLWAFGRPRLRAIGDTERDRDPYRRTSFAGSRAPLEPATTRIMANGATARSTSSTATMTIIAARTSRASRTTSATGASTGRAKRQLLGQIREHMEVVGSDDEHVGTVDRVAGDRIILTKSDPRSRRRPSFAELHRRSTGSRATR